MIDLQSKKDFCWFDFFAKWHVNFRELANTKTIIVEEQ